MKQMDEMKLRPRLRLSAVERLIEKHRIVVPVPNRRTLIRMCEDGRLDGVRDSYGWLVFEDSFWRWARGLGGEAGDADV